MFQSKDGEMSELYFGNPLVDVGGYGDAPNVYEGKIKQVIESVTNLRL